MTDMSRDPGLIIGIVSPMCGPVTRSAVGVSRIPPDCGVNKRAPSSRLFLLETAPGLALTSAMILMMWPEAIERERDFQKS